MYPLSHLGGHALYGHNGGMIRNNIAQLRRMRDMTQSQLAEAIGTTRSMLAKLEGGTRPLTSKWIEKLADKLDVEPFRIIAPERLFPTEEQLADMLRLAQQQIPAGLPYSEWPKAVAGGLHMRLQKLADDRANAASVDGAD